MIQSIVYSLLLGLLTVNVTSPSPLLHRAPVGQSGQWQLLFADHFGGNQSKHQKWVTCFWWNTNGCTIATNHELQWYQPHNVTVHRGQLRLRARENVVYAPDGRRFVYTSGMVSSGRLVDDLTVPPKFAFQYGYVEIRAKVPRGKGLWTALWLLPTDHESRPEIDVMEILGDTPNRARMHFHYLEKDGQKKDVGADWVGPDFSADWHVFAVDWQSDQLIWYVEGVERWRFSESAYIPAEPMYILANLAVGGDWPGAPDAQTTFPSDLVIDYIRVWQRLDR